MITRAFLVAWLTLVWVLLWGEPSLGNVLAGLLLATLLVVCFPPGPDRDGGVHPLAVLRFGVWFAKALVVSTASVAMAVLRPRLRLEEGIVAVPLRATSPIVVTFVANAISLTPGTLTVDIRPRSFGSVGRDPSTGSLPVVDGVVQGPVLYVHCLTTGDPDQVRADGLELEEYAVAAFGTAEDRLAVQGPPPVWPRPVSSSAPVADEQDPSGPEASP